MARTSHGSERVLWQGAPAKLSTPGSAQIVAAVAFAASAVWLSFAVVISEALGESPTATVGVALVFASLGLLALHGPRIWLEKVRYTVTRDSVTWERGPLRRTIDISAISYARLTWLDTEGTIGDLDLVRAVPTGPLARRLRIRLQGIEAPDAIWALIRGSESAQRGSAKLSVSQRLERDERVLWSETPTVLGRPIPTTPREWRTLGLSVLLFATFAALAHRLVPNLRVSLSAGLAETPAALGALVTGEGLVLSGVLTAAVYMLYNATLLRRRRLRNTRYVITNQRVLIQRGTEELHLVRDRIVALIETPREGHTQDVFLILDGPRGRAYATSGAFGDASEEDGLEPVLTGIRDVETLHAILLGAASNDSSVPTPRAA